MFLNRFLNLDSFGNLELDSVDYAMMQCSLAVLMARLDKAEVVQLMILRFDTKKAPAIVVVVELVYVLEPSFLVAFHW